MPPDTRKRARSDTSISSAESRRTPFSGVPKYAPGTVVPQLCTYQHQQSPERTLRSTASAVTPAATSAPGRATATRGRGPVVGLSEESAGGLLFEDAF